MGFCRFSPPTMQFFFILTGFLCHLVFPPFFSRFFFQHRRGVYRASRCKKPAAFGAEPPHLKLFFSTVRVFFFFTLESVFFPNFPFSSSPIARAFPFFPFLFLFLFPSLYTYLYPNKSIKSHTLYLLPFSSLSLSPHLVFLLGESQESVLFSFDITSFSLFY